MNKSQMRIIAAMFAAALAFAALVVFRDDGSTTHPSAAQARQAGEAHEAEEAEGHIALSEQQLKASGITVENAAPGTIVSTLRFPGEIHLNEDRTAHVVPRVDGVVESVSVSLGQVVQKGQVLAVVASPAVSEQRSALLAAQKRLELARTVHAREKQLWENRITATQDYEKAQHDLREARIAVDDARQRLQAIGASEGSALGLNRFAIKAPFAGTIVEKHITLGEAIGAATNILTLSDLSVVWAELIVPAKDIEQVRVGGAAVVRSTTSSRTANGEVSYVGALIGEQTRSAKARVVLPNPDNTWRPGSFVDVDLALARSEVPVSVDVRAIQTVGTGPAVFARVADGFVLHPVVTGRSDGSRIEIVTGLAAGTPHAVANSFVLKAELGKGAGGGHGH